MSSPALRSRRLALGLAAGLAAGLMIAATPPTSAADTASTSSRAATDPLAATRERIQAGDWTGALNELKRLNDVASADWQNLMGYCLRKATPPDFDAAERHYDEALRINPRHRGALEYSGELYLMKGDLAKAEQRLEVLDRACLFGCDEYTDLKRAIARYKAAGNRYTAGAAYP